MKTRKIIIILLSLIIILTLFNYGPMLYRRITGNGGSWVEYYNYNVAEDNLLSDILKIKKDNRQLWLPNDTAMSVNQNEYVYIKFYHNRKYYHTWVNIKKSNTKSLLIFGGISSTPNYEDAKLINRDMDYISREEALNEFKQIVLDKLAYRPTNS